MNKRPCECGHLESQHEIYLTTSMYCKQCSIGGTGFWCYFYRSIGNLEYLEWLSK